jgi:O-antigen ligase
MGHEGSFITLTNMIFERINKILLLCAIVLLLFRNGSFGVSGVPKPFEIGIILVSVLTLIYLAYTKKWKEFFYAVPKRIRIALVLFYTSVAIGWGIATLVRGMPTKRAMVLEIGMFSVAVVTFLLVLFYARTDKRFIRHVLYALCVPLIFSIVVVIPELGFMIDVARGSVFKGFTDNVEIVSKTLLIPLMVSLVYAVRIPSRVWESILGTLSAVCMTALVIWTTQRASILAVVVSMGIVWVVLAIRQRDLKSSLLQLVLIASITVAGFALVPYEGKKASVNRALNTDTYQSQTADLADASLQEILDSATITQSSSGSLRDTEPRIRIWEYYLGVVVRNPLGLGPNTHMDALIPHVRRTFVNPGPHNAYIEAALWGGVVGLGAILYIFGSALRRLYIAYRDRVDTLALAILGALVALLVAICFNDNLPSYWLWILLALSFRI